MHGPQQGRSLRLSITKPWPATAVGGARRGGLLFLRHVNGPLHQLDAVRGGNGHAPPESRALQNNLPTAGAGADGFSHCWLVVVVVPCASRILVTRPYT